MAPCLEQGNQLFLFRRAAIAGAGQHPARALLQGLCLRAVMALFHGRVDDCQCLLRLACLQQTVGVGIMKVASLPALCRALYR